ncbi:MAG: HEAT repeat domain-containing protein [Pirellulales bacterium]|nr:HEAT repeat domain-containing protein [Pirellulales bacterium]
MLIVVSLVWGHGSSRTVHAEPPSPEFLQTVIDLLKDPDKEVRALALDQIRSDLEGEAATKAFAAELPNMPPDAQAALISALADRGDRAARDPVLRLLRTSPDEPVRIAALRSLGSLGQAEDAKLLVESLEADSAPVREAAQQSLARLPGEAATEAIAVELETAKPASRVPLIDIVRHRGGRQALPQLLKAASDRGPTVRQAAIAALGALAGPEDVTAIVPLVLGATAGAERDAAERALASACGGGERRADPLIAAMQDLPRDERTALLPALGRVGGAAALGVVQDALADEDFNRHDSAIRALCNWPDASIASQLKHLASADEHPAHQRTALRALIRVAPLDDGRSDAERLALVKEVLAMCTRDDDRQLVLQRAAAVHSLETLQFLLPFLDDPRFAQTACQSVVELAHDRRLREPNKARFDPALDKVIATSNDPVAIERAQRYKKGQTWARPKR